MTQKTRRDVLKTGSTASAALALSALAGCDASVANTNVDPARFGTTPSEAKQIAVAAHEEIMRDPNLKMHGSARIAMLVYPGMTMLDMVGPQYFFASMMGAQVDLVTTQETLNPIMGDTRFAVVPTKTMAQVQEDLDILFVGGGTSGTLAAMKDQRVLGFLADHGKRAKWVTSVCTGSLLLGQAGLLAGKRATSHWMARHILEQFGATPVDARVVRDGKVLTGAGVSAGIDFAIELVSAVRSPRYAKFVQLQAEYAPQPPFNAGTPKAMGHPDAGIAHEMFATFIHAAQEVAGDARR
ncbi:MAG: DJ-1/PfpI family protein [Sphingomonadales bacterium]